MITKLKLDERAKLEFGVAITGAVSSPDARFIIESPEFSIMLPCVHVSGGVEVKIPALKNIIPAGEYRARLEIILDSKIYTPIKDSIVFKPTIEIATRQKTSVAPIKESVKVAKITVKREGVSETTIRRTQAAMIIAQALNYLPESSESPEQIIASAMLNVDQLSENQRVKLRSMIQLAESAGIIITTQVPDKLIIVDELKTQASNVNRISKTLISEMVSGLTVDDYLEAYTPGEFVVVDSKSGKVLTEEVLPASSKFNGEYMKDRVRTAQTGNKQASLVLYTFSSPEIVEQKATHIAEIAVRKKLATKPVDSLRSADRSNIKEIIANRNAIIANIAESIIPIIHSIEKTKLSHVSVTK